MSNAACLTGVVSILLKYYIETISNLLSANFQSFPDENEIIILPAEFFPAEWFVRAIDL